MKNNLSKWNKSWLCWWQGGKEEKTQGVTDVLMGTGGCGRDTWGTVERVQAFKCETPALWGEEADWVQKDKGNIPYPKYQARY